MTGEFTALSLACGLGFATVCCHSGVQRVCRGPGFQLAADSTAIMRQGTTQTFDVIVYRHPDFDPTLRFQVAAPHGVRASLSASQLNQNQDGLVRLTVSVDADAPLGCRIVTVAAFSEYRQVVTIPVRIQVEGDCRVQ